MIKGWVTEAWAARHANGWFDEHQAPEGYLRPRE